MAEQAQIDYGFFTNLVEAVKSTPGCLGVEVARTGSGKEVIFAWFENKQAVLRWYYSDFHQQLQKTFFPEVKPRPPLPDVVDDSGPIMAIASLTISEQAQFGESTLPISQISIEIYQPVTGGLFLGSRFAPREVKVARMRDYTPQGAGKSEMTDLELRFNEAMLEIYVRAKRECNYNATRFFQMLSERGGLATAKTLLATAVPSEGFTALWECERLDLTVEAHVLRTEFAPLFSNEERAIAKRRLDEYGYKFS